MPVSDFLRTNHASLVRPLQLTDRYPGNFGDFGFGIGAFHLTKHLTAGTKTQGFGVPLPSLYYQACQSYGPSSAQTLFRSETWSPIFHRRRASAVLECKVDSRFTTRAMAARSSKALCITPTSISRSDWYRDLRPNLGHHLIAKGRDPNRSDPCDAVPFASIIRPCAAVRIVEADLAVPWDIDVQHI